MLAAVLPSDLPASHELLHALLAVPLPGIILFRPVYAEDDPATLVDLAYVQLNPAAQQMLRLPAQPLDTFLTLYPSAQETGIFTFYRDTFLSGQPGEYAVNYAHDGLDNFFRLSARRSGELLLVGFTDTATQDRSEVEQALRESQAREQAAHAEAEAQRQRFYDVLMQLPAQVALNRGPDHVYDLVNPRYQQQFPARMIQGLPVREALPELAGQQFFELLDQVYQTGEPFYGRAMPAAVDYTDSGQPEVRYFDVFFQALRDVQGRIDGVLNFAYDVTAQVEAGQQVQALNEELKAANVELHASNQQLVRTNVDLDTFVYTASHDLKAPIANIESIVTALRGTLPLAVQQQEVVAHLLELLNQTVARFQFTIDQLTDITKLQLAHAGPTEPVVLAQVVEGVRLDLAPSMLAAGTYLTVAVAPELVVSFSPANLRSVVYNLLSNAVKYRASDRPSMLQVRAGQRGPHVVLEVQDNGLGMSEVQQRQLFGLFQRLHTHVEGTGVGLYITKRLIENAGGTITVQSQPNQGTTFTVTFPA